VAWMLYQKMAKHVAAPMIEVTTFINSRLVGLNWLSAKSTLTCPSFLSTHADANMVMTSKMYALTSSTQGVMRFSKDLWVISMLMDNMLNSNKQPATIAA